MSKPETMMIDNVKYIREDSVKIAPVEPTGDRKVVVVDRGWIFGGNVTEKDGKVFLTRAVNVQHWSSVGFDGMIKEPKSSKVNIKVLDHSVEIPAGSVLFMIPVKESWGL